MPDNDKVYITLDRPRELRLDHSAQKKLYSAYKLRVEDLNPAKLTPENLERVMLCLLEADARENGETLTIGKVDELLNYVKPGKVIRKIMAALEAAFAPDEDDDDFETWNSGGEKTEENPTTA